jgi:membrane-associated phospholipid phosphatase
LSLTPPAATIITMITGRVLEVVKKADVDLSYRIFKSVPKTAKTKSILKGLEWSCNGIIWLTLTLALMCFFPANEAMKHLMAGLIMDIVYVALTKAYARRVRPSYAQQNDQFGVISVDKHSFPSGHATRAIYVSYFASLYAPSLISFVIWCWALAVCVSRVLLGRHHVADVAAGFLIGSLHYMIQFVIGFPVYPLLFWLLSTFVGEFGSKNDLDPVLD